MPRRVRGGIADDLAFAPCLGHVPTTTKRGFPMTCFPGRWESVPLEMSRGGIANFAMGTRRVSPQPAVYVHVELPTGRVLRVGKAETGVHRRWTASANGHLSTFEWAMGWSDR